MSAKVVAVSPHPVPPFEAFRQYTGAHCRRLWAQVGEHWRCPSCRRSKFEIMRWTTCFPNGPRPYQDWRAILHKHHDHSVELAPGVHPRFAQVILCDQCNAADGVAKKALGLPKWFSFAAWEIGSFVVAQPHAPHELDLEKARAIFDWICASHPEFAFRLPPSGRWRETRMYNAVSRH